MNTVNNKEFEYRGAVIDGFLMLFLLLVILGLGIYWLVLGARDDGSWLLLAGGVVLVALSVFMTGGLFTKQPNQSRVMVFFGKYKGTCRKVGFYWCNPLMKAVHVSLRISNMDIDPIKVNDKVGNPVMIGMVLVWRVRDTYRAVFDVDETGSGNVLDRFVRIQSDAALREVTGLFAYDNDSDTSHSTEALTLRSGGEEINDLLEHKLNERLAIAGIEVVEARLNYLAYAPEIAAVMLRRQQAAAIISAREKIVEGAVSMVKMALSELSEQQIVELDEERKAAMVSNLLVVLCADEPAQPVINTGSLYN